MTIPHTIIANITPAAQYISRPSSPRIRAIFACRYTPPCACSPAPRVPLAHGMTIGYRSAMVEGTVLVITARARQRM